MKDSKVNVLPRERDEAPNPLKAMTVEQLVAKRREIGEIFAAAYDAEMEHGRCSIYGKDASMHYGNELLDIDDELKARGCASLVNTLRRESDEDRATALRRE